MSAKKRGEIRQDGFRQFCGELLAGIHERRSPTLSEMSDKLISESARAKARSEVLRA